MVGTRASAASARCFSSRIISSIAASLQLPSQSPPVSQLLLLVLKSLVLNSNTPIARTAISASGGTSSISGSHSSSHPRCPLPCHPPT